MNKEYAMYRGDEFIDLSTLDYLAQKYHKNEAALLDQLIQHYPLLPKCESYLRSNERLRAYNEFIEFVHKYAKSDYYFEFC